MTPEPIPNQATPKSAAAYWLTRARSGEMSAEDMRAFEVWLAKDTANALAYKKAETIWTAAAGVIDDPAIIASRERNVRALDARTRAWRLGAAAAGLLLAVAGGWTLANTGVFQSISLGAAQRPQELRTTVGQRTIVTLRDNSVVMLDTDTVLRLHESWRERRIELVRGRAFFEVAKDKNRPFIVAADGKTVRATGTAFDVRLNGQAMEVTLVEGRVRVQSAAPNEAEPRTADMRAGWRLAAIGEENWRMTPVDLRKETSWHDGVLTFVRDPLQDAVAEMNRYSDRKVVLPEGASPSAVVSGVFKTGDVEGFANAIVLSKFARVRMKTQDRIELEAP